MKNFILLFIAVILFMSCGICKVFTPRDRNAKKEDTNTETEKSKPKTPEVETKEETSQGDSKRNSEDGIEILNFDKSGLPSDIKYSGNIITGKRWKDKNGENILVITRTKDSQKKSKQSDFEEYVREANLYAYHYTGSGNSFSLLWKVNDLVENCGFDLTLDYISGSLSITDINKNGIAESTFMYRLTCRSDVSPSTLKLIMHEGDNKYALRGYSLITLNGMNEGGDYTVDKSFDSAPDGFLDYAKTQWKGFRLESFK
ncbi:MAG: hypothetical protein PHN88_01070 [Ignavibacteria bacterium]|nr:hypothetical protein [Ignavibacteria bacterium]